MIPRLLALACSLLAGCAEFPDPQGRFTATGDTRGYPRLRPIPELLAPASSAPAAPADDLAARAGALDRRAGRLRGTDVVDDATAARLSDAVARTARRE